MNSTFRRNILFMSLFSPSLYAEPQSSFSYEGKSYFVQSSGIRVLEKDQVTEFEVNTKVISVKPKSTYQSAEVNNYLSQQNLTVLRVASTGFMDIDVSSRGDFQTVLFELVNSGLFDVVEPTTYGRYGFVPNDTQYASQWHLPQVHAPDAWDLTSGAASVVVAVLDSGTEFTHDDLGSGSDGYQNVWLNAGEDAWSDPDDPTTGNGIDDDGNGFVDDWKGYNFDLGTNDSSGLFYHGTAVAGMVAAKTNNNLGVAGVAGGNNSAGVSIMIGNIGVNSPNGSVLDDAILYAAAQGARIVQMSLTVGSSAAIDAAIDDVYNNHGVLVVNAAGNSATNFVGYPASHPNVMAVGATNQVDSKVSFSQYGPNLEIAAPGVDMLMPTTGNGYTTSDGTSFSAPLVSGVAGLVFSRHPTLSNIQVREILIQSADKVGGYDYNHDLSDPGRSLELGYGRVNAESALLLSDLYAPFNGLIFKDGFEGDVIFVDGFE